MDSEQTTFEVLARQHHSIQRVSVRDLSIKILQAPVEAASPNSVLIVDIGFSSLNLPEVA